ncbi:integrase catalytic domain-containing protein [Trichonephila clavipes]|nr:integrase catalytic domain-containing protein [Trichonephila clavipes]
MLSSVGLLLRKWASNYNELLNSIDSDMRLSNASLNIDNDNTVKTLEHYFLQLLRLSIHLDGCHPSQSSIKQSCRLWKQQLQWDERVPPAKDVQLVKDIKIPRFLFFDTDNQFHLFGFSDASEKAYAAAIYCPCVSDTGKINVQLIITKARVTPLKPVSLPRLELRGALLLN